MITNVKTVENGLRIISFYGDNDGKHEDDELACQITYDTYNCTFTMYFPKYREGMNDFFENVQMKFVNNALRIGDILEEGVKFFFEVN